MNIRFSARRIFISLLFLTVGVVCSPAAFAVCDPATNPDAATFCDIIMHPENFDGGDSGKVCVAEPAPPLGGSNPETLGASICVSGSLENPENLVTLFVEVNSLDVPVDVPPRVEIDPNTLVDASFEENVSLPSAAPGTYIAATNALFIGGMGMPNIVTVGRQFVKVGQPDLKITSASLRIADQDLTPGISQDAGTGIYTLAADPIASRRLDLCLSNPDGDASGAKVLISVTNNVTRSETQKFALERPCPSPEALANAETEAFLSCCQDAGIDLTCCDGSAEEGTDCSAVDSLDCPVAAVFCGREASCSNGFLISDIALGENINDLSIRVQNSATGYGIGDGQVIDVAPLTNQLEQAELCTYFYDQNGQEIPLVDGQIVSSSEVDEMTVRVSFGACGDTAPGVPVAASGCDVDAPRLCNDFDKDGLLDIDDPDNNNDGTCDRGGEEGEIYTCADMCEAANVEDCAAFLTQINIEPCPSPSTVLCSRTVAGDPVSITRACLQKGNDLLPYFVRGNNDVLEREFYEMCPIAGNNEAFMFKLGSDDLQFPLGAISIEAELASVATRRDMSFAYGQLRSRFNDSGELLLDEVNSALAGFIPASFFEVINNDNQAPIIDDVEAAMNTESFKNDILLALFDPQAPNQEAVDQCDFIGPAPDRFRTFKIYEPNFGTLDITSLRLLNNNRAWVQLVIGGLQGYAEIFSVQCDTPDCEGLKINENDQGGAPFRVDGASLVADADLGIGVLPMDLTITNLTVNIEAQLSKDENGLTVTTIRAIPGYDLIKAFGPGGRLARLRCDVAKARITDAAHADKILWVDQPACEALKDLNEDINGTGLEPGPTSANISTQLVETIKSQVSCLTPKILTESLAEFATKPLLPVTLTLFGKEFSTKAFADLLKADLTFSPRGLSFKGGTLALPAGTFPEGDPTPEDDRDAIAFMNALPDDLKTSRFGYVADKENAFVNPISSARGLGKNVNLAVKEELVNMILHGVNTLMIDLLSKEPDFIDTNDFGVIDRFGIGVFVDTETCLKLDDDGQLVEVPIDDQASSCFPLRLRPDLIFGGFDLDSDGSLEASEANTPLRFRLNLNPAVPPMAQLVGSSALEDNNGRSETVMLTLKIALSDAELEVYEDESFDANPRTNLEKQVNEGLRPSIVSWCDRQPEASPDCMGDAPLPLASFRLDAAVTAWLQYTTDTSNGEISIKAGIMPRELHKPNGEIALVPDQEASFFKVALKKNNTPYASQDLVGAMNANLNNATLNLFAFGLGNEFALSFPTVLPEEASCDDEVEEDSLEELLHDFGFRSLGLDDPLLMITGGNPRYLAIGFDPILNRCDDADTTGTLSGDSGSTDGGAIDGSDTGTDDGTGDDGVPTPDNSEPDTGSSSAPLEEEPVEDATDEYDNKNASPFMGAW